MVTPTDRPTDQPTDKANIEQSAFWKVRQKKEGRDLQFVIVHELSLQKEKDCLRVHFCLGRSCIPTGQIDNLLAVSLFELFITLNCLVL